MSINSKRITDLYPISVPTDDSYFVVADSNNSNKKISYESIKENISESVRQMGIYSKYPPQNDATNTLALGAGVGRNIYQNISTRIPINGSTTNVSTPINFSGTITSKTPSGSNLKEVVNIEYFNRKSGSLFGDFTTRDFLYGSYLYTILGPLEFDKTDPNNWVYVDTISEKNRTNAIGWQKFKNGLTINLLPGKRISDYKKLIVFLSDESGEGTSDNDVQIFPFEIDCSFYIYMCELERERIRKYNALESASKKNPVQINVNGQKITYNDKKRTKNFNSCVYIGPNVYQVNNGSVQTNGMVSVRDMILKYTDNYNTSLTAGTADHYIVSIMGLK